MDSVAISMDNLSFGLEAVVIVCTVVIFFVGMAWGIREQKLRTEHITSSVNAMNLNVANMTLAISNLQSSIDQMQAQNKDRQDQNAREHEKIMELVGSQTEVIQKIAVQMDMHINGEKK